MRVLFVVYDNDSYIHWFPQGTAYLAAALKNVDIDVEIYNQDMHHYSDAHLTEYLDKNHFDVVGVGVIAGYYQYRKLLKISGAINRSKQRPFFMIGGHGPSPEPEFFLRKTQADVAVIGEGELTVVELMTALSCKTPLQSVAGIAFRDGDCVHINPRRELIADIDTIALPAFNLFPVNYYRLLRFAHATPSDFVMPVLSGRGCPFKCTFCYRIDEGHRLRSNESVIEEIQYLKKNYGITFILFSDELLMCSEERVISLCRDFIQQKLNIKWNCQGRFNYATPDVLKLMKQAGCVFINYGIESMDDQVLKNMRKGLTVKQIIRGIEATLAADISPGFNIIFGNVGDTRETLRKGVELLLKYDDASQMRTIRPVTPYPGSELYYYAIKIGLLKDCKDFYENKHTNSDLLSVNFTELSDEEFHEALLEANKTLISNYFENIAFSNVKQAEQLYQQKDASFRGFRQT